MSDSDEKASGGGIGEADAVLLSAYLDDELSDDEKAALERRLAAEPGLKAELDALRASGDALRQADALGTPASNESALYLTTVRRRLQEEWPDEDLPVAAALRPSRLRHLALICAAGLAAVLLLTFIIGLLQRLGLPTPSGWSARPLEGKVAIERRERIVLALDQELLLVGDRLHLDHGELAEMAGPADLTVKLSGPAVLRCDAHGLFLERGHAEIEGAAGSASALQLTTPDGRIHPEGNGDFNFVVDVNDQKHDAP